MHIQSTIGTRGFALAAFTIALGIAPAGAAHATSPSQPSASVAAGTLTVLGTRGDDAIEIEVDPGDPNTLLVDLGNGSLPQRFDRSTFGTIAVFLRRGDDSFRVLAGGSLADERLVVRGGADNDTIAGGDGADRLFGGWGDDDLQGGDGIDLIVGNAGRDSANGNRGDDTELLGRGNDVASWNPGEGSDDINGGRGDDTLAFNGSDGDEEMALVPNGSDAVFLRNLGTIRMDMSSVEALELAALGGADEIVVDNMAGTDVRAAGIDLASTLGAPDGAMDTVTVNGRNVADRIQVDADQNAVDVSGLTAQTRISGSDTTDQLFVNSRGGDDAVEVSNAAEALMDVVVDLGTGQR